MKKENLDSQFVELLEMKLLEKTISSSIFENYRNQGGLQIMAYRCLMYLIDKYKNYEKWHDVLVDWASIVIGFCPPHNKIWETCIDSYQVTEIYNFDEDVIPKELLENLEIIATTNIDNPEKVVLSWLQNGSYSFKQITDSLLVYISKYQNEAYRLNLLQKIYEYIWLNAKY